jgi:ATP-dependent exoDNAse (exonuclease V) beta subunit
MTRSGQLRKRLTAKDGIADTTLRRQLNTWLDTLHGRGLAPALSAFAKLPRPEAGIDNTPTLQLYCVGLALAAIELERILQAEGCLDFTGLLLRAQAALRNSEDAPTDLALYLDYQIRHVLIDEFQDTSRSQLKLFEHLIDGWQANDGTSLFMVGDPMQSIYRFRDADVSIIAEVQQAGLAGVALEPCGLQANFRSQPTLVEWCNGVFTKLFAAGARQPGAVSFNP